ncbi:hypothetical protein ACM1ZW_20690 [Pseudomonas sp. NFX71]|uniref:hypothetical protein n=1 Tax=Pseudomonas sp. NFX71 TaxID=3399121 RepID=UPI003A84B038
MLGISKQTFLQLVKEFRIPLVVAVGWTTYAVWGPEVSFKKLIETFGTSFFLASWMTGQIFRVRKQAGIEDSLSKVQTRIELVTENLEHQTKQLMGYVTGGDSFVFFRVKVRGDNTSLWMAAHGGGTEFPVYRAQARIVDLDVFDALLRSGRSDEASTFISIGDLLPRTFNNEWEHDLGNGNSRSFNIFITAGNGHIQQKIRFRRVNDVWTQATRVLNDNGVVHLYADDEYPKDESGEICWD